MRENAALSDAAGGVRYAEGDRQDQELRIERSGPRKNDPVLVNGSPDIAQLPPEISARTGGRFLAKPVRLMNGRHFGKNRGYGIAHIGAEHADQIGSNDPMDVARYAASVVRNATRIYDDGSGRLILQNVGTPKGIAFVELRDDGDFYSIVTAFAGVQRGRLVWSGRRLHISTQGSGVTASAIAPTTEQSGSSSAGTAQLPASPKQPLETLANQTSENSVADESKGFNSDDQDVRFNVDDSATRLAPNGQPSNLNERQWQQVRTPEFRAWFGDWERVAKRGALDSMTPIDVDYSAFGDRLADPVTFEAKAKAAYASIKKATNSIDGSEINFVMTGYRKLLSHSADASTLEIVAGLKPMMERAIPIYSEPHPPSGRPHDSTRAWHTYAARAVLDGRSVYVKLVVREDVFGKRTIDAFHDATVTPENEVRAAGLRSSTPLSMQEETAWSDAPDKDKLRQWYVNVNPSSVSKVVDENGEPLVVYHGTVADLTQFDKTETVDGGFHFGEAKQANMRVAGASGRNLMPVYLSITSPRRSKDAGGRWKAKIVSAKSAGHDGLIYLNRYEGVGIETVQKAQQEGVSLDRLSDAEFRRYAKEARDSYVAFRPEQIKSATGNTGDFSTANPDIRFNIASGDPQPLNASPVASGNLWQAAKAKAAALLTPGRIDQLIYEFQDKYVDLRRIRDHLREIGGTITDMNDAYLGEELYHKRLAHQTQSFLKVELRPLLADMKARGVGMEELETFLHARHAPEANAEMARRNPNQAEIDAGRKNAATVVRGPERNLQTAQARGLSTKAIEQALNEARGDLVKWHGAQSFHGTEQERRSLSGMTDQAAAAIMAGLTPPRRADLDALAARVDAINAGTLQLLRDYGLMSESSLDAWRRTYQFYVPLHRDEAHPDSANHPVGQGFSVKGEAAKRRTGSNQKVTHILGHIAMQREAALTRGEKNRVMLKLYLMARQNTLPDVWRVGIVPTIDTIDKATGFVESIPDPLYRNRPNVVMLRIAGKDVAITMNEHNPQALRMAQALKNLDVDDLHYLIPIVGRATRYFAKINTQYNPIFGIVNLLRDIQGAALNLSTTELAGKQGQIFKDQLRILGSVLKNNGRMPTAGPWAALFEEFNAEGGTTGYRDLYLQAEDRANALLEELKALDRGQASKAAHAVFDWLSDYNEALENATRLAAYKAALDQGMSKERAASLAKNLTVNFNRKGRQTRELGALYAFLNASIQGTTRMAQTLAGPAGRKIMAGGVALGALNAMLGIAMMGGGDDDEWEKIPEFVKERSIILPIGKQDYIAIPLPLGFHFLPNIGRLAVEMAWYKDKTAGKQMASLFTIMSDAFNPLGGSAPALQIAAPTVLDPLVALAQNKDWTGRPIYVENFNALDPEPGFKRTKDSATPWAKGFAEAINAITGGTQYVPGGWSPTPDQIDYVIGQLTGGVGREAGKVAATAAAPFTGEELPPYKVPLVGRLYGSTAGHSGQSEKFYENIRQANAVESEIKGRLKDGTGIAAYLQEHQREVDLAARGNAAERQVRELRRIRRGIVSRGEPDAASRAREVNEQMAGVMRGFNREVTKIGAQ